MTQLIMVTLLVLAAALYVVWALMPAHWRQKLGLPARGRGPPVAGGPASGGGCCGCDAAKPVQRSADSEKTPGHRPRGLRH